MAQGGARGRGRGSLVRRVLLHGEGSSREGGRSFSEVPYEDSVDVSFNASQHLAEGSHLNVVSEPTNNTGQLSRELTSVEDVPRPSKRKRKGRGPAIGIDKPKQLAFRQVIKFENGCPVDDTRDDFITKIGIWARDQQRFPYETSHFDEFQGDVWKTLLEDVNAYFNIDYDGNLLQLVMDICRRRWNDERSKMYRLNYACYDTHEEALLHPPKYIEPEAWHRICEVFHDPEWKKRSERNSINRSQQVLIHKSGRKSFTQNKVEMRQEKQREPHRFEIFQKCYKGKKGYANSPTRIATEKLVELAIENPENEDQAFLEVFGQEHKGRKRGMGRGITSCQNSEPSLRSQVEKLTQLQAEREKKDAERDQNDVEMRNQMKEIKTQLDILLNQLTPVFSNVPPQQQMTYNQQYQMPNQLQMQTLNYQHQAQIPYPQQQMQFPVYQSQMQFRHQKETFQQQMQGFTDLLRNGDDPRFGSLANPSTIANERQQEMESDDEI